MTTHSKGSYVAHRTGRFKLTPQEIAARTRIAKACKEYCEGDFPNGAVIHFDGGGNPV